ncbi:MAG: hypothetical protein AAF493_01220 [Pseudomonadota bacterium]
MGLSTARFTFIYDDPAECAAQMASPDSRSARAFLSLLAGKIDALGLGKSVDAVNRTPLALFPGAFNPLHDGHKGMADTAAEFLQCPVIFELSIINVDKPPMDIGMTAERCAHFDQRPLCLTNAPTFLAKSQLFPGATFVVGVDTIVRIADPHYYGGERARDGALEAIGKAGSRFLVFGRHDGTEFRSLTDVALVSILAELCDEVPESMFRQDISSTELRRPAADQ